MSVLLRLRRWLGWWLIDLGEWVGDIDGSPKEGS